MMLRQEEVWPGKRGILSYNTTNASPIESVPLRLPDANAGIGRVATNNERFFNGIIVWYLRRGPRVGFQERKFHECHETSKIFRAS